MTISIEDIYRLINNVNFPVDGYNYNPDTNPGPSYELLKRLELNNTPHVCGKETDFKPGSQKQQEFLNKLKEIEEKERLKNLPENSISLNGYNIYEISVWNYSRRNRYTIEVREYSYENVKYTYDYHFETDEIVKEICKGQYITITGPALDRNKIYYTKSQVLKVFAEIIAERLSMSQLEKEIAHICKYDFCKIASDLFCKYWKKNMKCCIKIHTMSREFACLKIGEREFTKEELIAYTNAKDYYYNENDEKVEYKYEKELPFIEWYDIHKEKIESVNV